MKKSKESTKPKSLGDKSPTTHSREPLPLILKKMNPNEKHPTRGHSNN